MKGKTNSKGRGRSKVKACEQFTTSADQVQGMEEIRVHSSADSSLGRRWHK